jgi:hypothetical protein
LPSLWMALGSFEEEVVSLAGAGIAGAVIQESGFVFLSGTTSGAYPMNDDEARIAHGREAAQRAADVHSGRHQASCRIVYFQVDRSKGELDHGSWHIRSLTGLYHRSGIHG